MAVLDLERRVAVVRAGDDGAEAFPHALRGTLAALLADPTWHVVVAFDEEGPARPEVAEVLDQAREWARQGRCRLSVTSYRDVARVRAAVAAPGSGDAPAGAPGEVVNLSSGRGAPGETGARS